MKLGNLLAEVGRSGAPGGNGRLRGERHGGWNVEGMKNVTKDAHLLSTSELGRAELSRVSLRVYFPAILVVIVRREKRHKVLRSNGPAVPTMNNQMKAISCRRMTLSLHAAPHSWMKPFKPWCLWESRDPMSTIDRSGLSSL